MEGAQPNRLENEDSIDLIDLLIVLAKHKKLIIGGTLGAGIVMAVISLIMTPVYRAETKIYVPQSSPSLSAQLLIQLGPLADMAGEGKQTPNDLYIEILKSSPVRDRIIARFDLMKVYESETREAAQRALLGRIMVKQNIKSGVITFGVEDTDSRRSAAMTNAFIEEFRSLNKALALTESSQRRLFFEEQLKDAKDDLSKAEDAMQAFQEKTGAIKIDAQAETVIEEISQLRAQIAAKEEQLKVMHTYSTSRNPDIQRAEAELKGMREHAQRLESKNSGDSVIVSTGNLPSAGTEYLRRMRDLKFNETLYGLLVGQYQTAKLDEARDSIAVQVIEKAEPPEKRIKPKRTIMAILAMFAGFFIAVLAAFLGEFKEGLEREPESRERLNLLKRYGSFRIKPLENTQHQHME